MASGLKKEPRRNVGCSASPRDKVFKDKGVIVLTAVLSSSKMRTTGHCSIKVRGGLHKKSIRKTVEANHDWNGFQRKHTVRNWRQ